MLDIELNGTEPKHVERITPSMSTGASGEINWTPSLLDYDASLFYRGKQVTNEEFNELFLKQLYQGNYIADSLSELFKNHLGNAIYRTFTHTFNLKKSYTKVFTPAEWGTIHEDGYYYITIPAEEHGFLQSDEGSAVDNMNIDTEMYVLDSDGQFHEVMQVEVDTNNTVHLYTDDNTLAGFVVVRSNDKSYRLADDVDIDASDVNGLHPVAISGRYQDLEGLNDVDGPITLINKLNSDILDIIEGSTVVPNAEEAVHADTTSALLLEGTIQGIPVSNIFETGSNYVKDATHAVNADNAVQTATGAWAGFTQDSAGTLKLNEEIISRRRVLWQGSVTSGSPTEDAVTVAKSEAFLNKILEIKYKAFGAIRTLRVDTHNMPSYWLQTQDIFRSVIGIRADNNEVDSITIYGVFFNIIYTGEIQVSSHVAEYPYNRKQAWYPSTVIEISEIIE